MMITIEPMELVATSETLRTCSIEAADIGSQLWACSQCPMPADIQGAVDELVVAADRALDSVATELIAQALDLTRRAVIAIMDSQGTSAVAGESQFAMTAAGGTTNIGIAGWSPFDGMTVTGTDGLTAGWLEPMAQGTSTTFGGDLTGGWLDPMTQTTTTIGGDSPFASGFTITTPNGSPVDTGTWMTTMTIGAPDYSSGPLAGVMALVDAQQNLSGSAMLGGVGLGGSPSALKVAMDLEENNYVNAMHTLSTSRTQLDEQYGYHLSDSDVNMISPFTLPRSPMSFG